MSDVRKLQQPQPINGNAIDLERARLIEETDAYALKSLKAVAKAVIEKAKAGDKTCAELYFKYLANPIRQEHGEQAARKPSPTPPIIRAQMFLMFSHDARDRIELTERDYKELNPDYQRRLEGRVKFLELPAESPQEPPAGAVAQLTANIASRTAGDSATPAPNRECPCGRHFYSNQPLAKYCADCKKQRSMARLVAHKRNHGKLAAVSNGMRPL